MNKASKILLSIFFSFFLTTVVSAQNHIIQGVVTTFDSIPLIGAEIKIQSTKQSTFTDSLGNFVIWSNSKDKLKVKAKGFYTQNVKISENTKVVAVNLKIKPGEKMQEYAIGYGYVSEADRTNAVSNLNTTNATFSKYNNIYDLISGQFSGVQVVNGEIIIRGSKSFNASSAALIIIDGVISDSDALRTLSPIQVKSVDVIKDGSSAVYGSRGANGVVIIETRKGGDEIK